MMDERTSKPGDTRFISLGNDTAGGDDPQGRPASRRRIVIASVAAVACLALVVVSLGFIHPAADGSWSIDGLFQTTADAPADGESSASGDMEDAPAAEDVEDAAATDGSIASEGEAETQDAVAASDSSASGGAVSAASAGTSSSTSSAGGGDTSSSGVAASGGTSSGGAAQAPAQPELEPEPAPQPATVTIRVSVSSSAVGNPVSASGTYTFAEGATAYDALKALGLSVNARQTTFGIYVAAIGGLAEFDHGDTSGWVYTVNGERINQSAGYCVLKDGDNVAWSYVTAAD